VVFIYISASDKSLRRAAGSHIYVVFISPLFHTARYLLTEVKYGNIESPQAV
jgi:hypothetical protein